MLAYDSGDTVVHRLDPRTKLAVQLGFALAIIATTDPTGVGVLTLVAIGITVTARVSLRSVLWDLRFVVPILVIPVAFEGVVLGSPWYSLAAIREPLLASYRVLLLLIVSATYVLTTPVRDSRAAVQWAIPGKPGQFLGMGVAFVFRFLPVLQSDLSRIRSAIHARLGGERSITERITLITTTGLSRALTRSDRLSTALKARCFAWNPTLPLLQFGRIDVIGLGVGLLLLLFALR